MKKFFNGKSDANVENAARTDAAHATDRRNEKRRVLLSKKYEIRKTFDKDKSPEENEAVQANGLRVVAKLQGMNKRVLAVVLAVAIVLGLIPGLMFAFRGKAEEVEQTSNLKPVTMDVRLNGQDGYTTATVPAGVVKDNAGDITFKGTMPEAALLQKTVLIDHQNNTETEVARVAKFKGNTYYSMNETDSSGTLLLATQDLVLVYAEQYAVNITSTGNGAYTTSANQDGDKLFVWGGEDLTIQCTPSQDYYTGQVEYKAGSADTKRITPKNNYVTIPAKNISGDLAITLPFVYVGTYSVNDVR